MASVRTGSRELFLRHYVAQGCQGLGAAYKAAGFSGTRQTAHRLLQDPTMKARLAVLLKAELQKVDITAERTMMELGRRAFGDVRDLFDADGKLLPIAELSDAAAASIDGIEIEVDKEGKPTTVKVRRSGKDAALSILSRHFKIAGHEIDEAVGKLATFAERLAEARERERKLRK
jgi:phage terminase small subunit